MYFKVKRPFLAAALIMGLGVTVASAYDYCNPCVRPAPVVGNVSPVVNTCPPMNPCPAPAPVVTPVANVCDPCGPSTTTVAADYSVPASMNTYSTASAMPVTTYSGNSQVAGYTTPDYGASSGITYIIPSMHGTLESTTIPVSDNVVDRWYSSAIR